MDLNVRFVYRGAFGITNTAGNVSGVLIPSSDRNGNAILDSYDQLVKGYTLTNLTMGKNGGTGIKFNWSAKIYSITEMHCTFQILLAEICSYIFNINLLNLKL